MILDPTPDLPSVHRVLNCLDPINPTQSNSMTIDGWIDGSKIEQERLVQFSTRLEDEALYTLMSSLQALAVVDLANTATVLPQERTSARERE